MVDPKLVKKLIAADRKASPVPDVHVIIRSMMSERDFNMRNKT